MNALYSIAGTFRERGYMSLSTNQQAEEARGRNEARLQNDLHAIKRALLFLFFFFLSRKALLLHVQPSDGHFGVLLMERHQIEFNLCFHRYVSVSIFFCCPLRRDAALSAVSLCVCVAHSH